MVKNQDMADEIRTAAHGEARKRNKSQDHAAHEKQEPEEEQKARDQSNADSKSSLKRSAQDEIEDNEVDRAFFYSAPKNEEIKFQNEQL